MLDFVTSGSVRDYFASSANLVTATGRLCQLRILSVLKTRICSLALITFCYFITVPVVPRCGPACWCTRETPRNKQERRCKV